MSVADSRVGTTFGKYEITGILGKGGMGEVYEAYDTEIRRTVALKIIKSQFADDHKYRARFERESHAVAKLQEPHVIPIHGFGEIDGCLFLDMRLVRGTDLQTMLETEPLAPARAVSIVGQIAAALDAAHADGLIHRDIKPQNIIITPADFAYLVDFGIAEVIGDTRLTAAGATIGSWAYMAPERFSDRKPTLAVDVYALTCVLYEALTGQLPFPAESQEGLVAGHLTSPAPRPSVTNPEVPQALDDVIARGMAKEPDDRYGSAGALGRAASRALHGFGRTSIDPGNPMPPPRPHTTVGDQHDFPPSGPVPVSSGERSAGSRWLVPTVIAVSAALVLGAIGVVIGLLVKPTPAPSPSAGPTPSASSPPGSSGISPVPLPTRPGAAALPPIITGPDQSVSHISCDGGYRFGNATGFGTHGGRGSPQTSCYFANTVLISYWNAYGNANTTPRPVSAPGAVDCNTVAGASCDPNNPANFLMHCGGDGANPWIKCTGGQGAVVYLW